MRLQTEHSLLLYFLLLVLAMLVSWLLYRKNTLNLSRGVFWILRILRGITLFALFVLLLNPFIEHIESVISKPVLILGVDDSKSVVSKTDVEKLSADITLFKERLSDKFQVKTMAISADATYTDSLTFLGSKSNLGSFIKHTNQYSKEKLSAAVLLSDGIYNEGFTPSVLSTESNIPIYTVLMGDTTKYPDVKIVTVRHNDKVRKGNETTLRVSVSSEAIRPSNFTVELKEGAQLLDSKTLSLGKKDSKELVFVVEPKDNGIHNYTVQLSTYKDELNTRNNISSFSIEVVEKQTKILSVYDALHPDVGVFSSVFQSSLNYDVESVNINTLNKTLLEGADLLVVRLLQKNNQDRLAGFLKESPKPVVYFLPQSVSYPSIQGVNLNAKRSSNFVFPALAKEFELFITDDLQDQFTNVPALDVPFGDYVFSANWKKLFTQNINGLQTDVALVAVNKDLVPAQAVFVGSGYWAWRMNTYARNKQFTKFDVFLQKLTNVLIQSGKGDPLLVDIDKKFSVDDVIMAKAFVYNNLNEFVEGKDVALSITSDSLTYDYTFVSGNNQYNLQIGSLPAGKYNWKASCEMNGLQQKYGSFVVEGFDLEMLDLTSRKDVMDQIALETNASSYSFTKINALAESLLNSSLSLPLAKNKAKKQAPIDELWFFILLVISLVGEIFFRRQFGLV